MKQIRYWLTVASRDHVMNGVTGGFMQANHGKEAPLKRMKPGDKVVFYSPKTVMGEKALCQCFTAIGQVADGEIYTVWMTEDFCPFRRNVTFASAQQAPIAPLITNLGFIKDKTSWGYVFRFGFLEIPEADFNLIASSMRADL